LTGCHFIFATPDLHADSHFLRRQLDISARPLRFQATLAAAAISIFCRHWISFRLI
jgi:hypothetical protein